MGDFYELQYTGTKVVKFKQEKLIEVLKEQKLIPAETYDEIKGGVCTAVCIAWIKFKYEPSSILGFHRAQHVKADDNETSLALIRDVAPKQINYVKEFEQSGEKASIWQLAQQERLQLIETLEDDGGDFINVIEQCMRKLSTNEAAIVCANIKDSKTGHSVALYKPAANELSFFDPNAGEYLIYRESLDFFLAKYKYILSKKEWVYTLTTAYQIGP